MRNKPRQKAVAKANDNRPIDISGGLWFYPDVNRFVDFNGRVIHDLHELFPEWVIMKWKNYCRSDRYDPHSYQQIQDRHGRFVDLYYTDEGIDQETLDFIKSHNRVFPDKSERIF